MVLNKRLDYGFNGYQVPPTPRAKRSARRRSSFKKRNEESQICAFDLLAIVAGNLLLEGRESAPSSSYGSADKDQCVVVNNTVQSKCQDEEKRLDVEIQDQGSPSRAFFFSDLSQVHEQNDCSKESLYIQNNLNLGLASAVTTPDCAQRSDNEILVNGKSKIEMQTFARKVEVGPAECHEFVEGKLEAQPQSLIEDQPQKSEMVQNVSVANRCSSEDPVVWDGKPPAHASSDSSAKLPFCGDSFPHSSYPINRDHVNVVSRDDDENSSGCTHPSTVKKSFRPARRIGDRRIRKILAAKYWRAGPRMKDGSLFNTDRDLKLVYRKRKNYYKYQRAERVYPFKKRKHFGYISPSHSDGGISSEFVLDSTQKSNYGHASGSCPKLHGATGAPSSIAGQHNSFRPRNSHGMRTFDGMTGAPSSIAGQHNSFRPRNSHVKLRIKSFKVPELVIEVPESATIGSLKRTVMDAVTALLGGGLRIGVLLQGKKVRDDSKTLLQTGISHDDQLDSLGFSLEPNPSQSPPALDPGDSSFRPPFDPPQPLSLSRYSPPACEVHQGSCATSQEPLVANVANLVESDHDSAPSPIDLSIDKSTTDSQSLVPLQAMNIEALAAVPAHRKSKHSEYGQRRIRRPFSVGEVEALVQAVEKLGTGRWRDVKLRAFEKAKHRTYVDLKDKWKTLVHTARISPQQRRGEPVPQELLDRVLAAHAYWSQQQAKQQLKQPQPETSLLL